MGSNSEHAYSSHAHAVNTIKEAGEHIRPIDTKVRYERRAIVAQLGRCNVIPGMVPNDCPPSTQPDTQAQAVVAVPRHGRSIANYFGDLGT